MTKLKKPGVGVSCIIIKDNIVLIGKRKSINGDGKWAFPGGHIEIGESFEQCVLREIKEETGLQDIEIIDSKPFAVTNDIYNNELHYITLFFRAKCLSGNPENKEPEKCYGWEWVKWNELPTPLFLPIENLLKQNLNILNMLDEK